MICNFLQGLGVVFAAFFDLPLRASNQGPRTVHYHAHTDHKLSLGLRYFMLALESGA